MAVETRLIFSSPNGDDWFLAYDRLSERTFVQHRANAASGGHVTESDIGDFLSRGPRNPEHLALLRLIGSLAHGEDHAERPGRPEAAHSRARATTKKHRVAH
jgi:hypothetical protein